MSWKGNLPTPTLEGDRATYADVSPGVDVQVQALPQGFEQFIVLKERPDTTPSYTLPIAMPGVVPVKLPGGGIELDNAQGERVGDVGTPLMFDSSDAYTPKTAVMTSSVTATAAGAEVVVTADQSFLDDPDTVYPVVLDPVVSLLQTTTDTYVKQASAATNYGTDTKLAIGKITSAATDINRGFVTWSMAGLAGKTISTARVKLSQYFSVSCTASLSQFYQVTGGWTATGATWNNQPTISGTAAASFTSATGGSCGATAYQTTTNTASMVNLVTGWANGTIANYGLSIRADESSTAAGKYFYSSESSAPPMLEVTSNSPPNIRLGPRPARRSPTAVSPTRAPRRRP